MRKAPYREQAPSSAREDAPAAELLGRLTQLHRRVTWVMLGCSLMLAVGVTGWALGGGDAYRGGLLTAKLIGVTGGITFGAVFLTSLGISWRASRAFMERKAETFRLEAIERHGLPSNALQWVVGMFTAPRKGMGFERSSDSETD